MVYLVPSPSVITLSPPDISHLLDRLQLLFRQRCVEAYLLEGIELNVGQRPVLVGVAHEEDAFESPEAKHLETLLDPVV